MRNRERKPELDWRGMAAVGTVVDVLRGAAGWMRQVPEPSEAIIERLWELTTGRSETARIMLEVNEEAGCVDVYVRAGSISYSEMEVDG